MAGRRRLRWCSVQSRPDARRPRGQRRRGSIDGTSRSLVGAELRRCPCNAAVCRHVDRLHAAVPAHGDAAQRHRRTGLHAVTVRHPGKPAPRYHSVDRHRLEAGLARFDASVRRVRNTVGRLHPETLVWRIQHLYVGQHLDPVGRVPARYDEAQREAVEQRQLLVVHLVSDHHLAVAGMVDVERLHKIGRLRHHRLIEAVEAHRHGTPLHASAVEHVSEPHAHPLGVAHRSVCPLRARDPWLEQPARVARTLVDGGQFDARHGQHLGQRLAQWSINVPPHGQAEGGGIDALGDHSPVPAHEEAIIWSEHSLVEHLERRLEQRRPRALQNHLPLLREGACHRPVAGVAR